MVAKSGKFGPSLLDNLRQLRPERCPKDGIPQTWRHGNGRARSIAPAMPPSLKGVAWDLETFEAPQASTDENRSVPYVRPQSEGCGASLNRADHRSPPLRRRPYFVHRFRPKRHRLKRMLTGWQMQLANGNWQLPAAAAAAARRCTCCRRLLLQPPPAAWAAAARCCTSNRRLRDHLVRAAEVPESPQPAQHLTKSRLARRPRDAGTGELWHRAALPAGLCRMLGPNRQQAAAASPALTVQHQGVQGRCCRPSGPTARLPGELLGTGGVAGRATATGAAPQARHPAILRRHRARHRPGPQRP